MVLLWLTPYFASADAPPGNVNAVSLSKERVADPVPVATAAASIDRRAPGTPEPGRS